MSISFMHNFPKNFVYNFPLILFLEGHIRWPSILALRASRKALVQALRALSFALSQLLVRPLRGLQLLCYFAGSGPSGPAK